MKKYHVIFLNKHEKYNDLYILKNNNAPLDMPILGDIKSPIYTNNTIETLRNANLDDINRQKKTLYSLLKKTHNTQESKLFLNYTLYRSIKHRYKKYDYKSYQFYKDNSRKSLSLSNIPLVNEYEF